MSPEIWALPGMQAALQQANDAARRLQKGIDVASERQRLAAANRVVQATIESLAAATLTVLDGEEANRALNRLPLVGAVQLPFQSPVDKEGDGLFFVAAADFDVWPPAPAPVFPAEPMLEFEDEQAASIDGRSPAKGRLASEIDRAASTNRPVSLGRSRHSEITRALRQNLYAQDGRKPIDVRLVYLDGSMSEPIRLREIVARERPKPVREFNVALVSCRHFDLDPEIDFCLLRNVEFDRQDAETFAEQEKFAFERAKSFFDLQTRAGAVRIRLFHTGLEPAVVGTYRAVIDSLRASKPLIVSPVLFVGQRDEQDEPEWW